MSYYIDIIDTVSSETRLIIEHASKSGIVLEWSGGDKKDELSIVGSNLIFDFAHRELIDAKFIKYFTGNETRFKVELRNFSDDSIIWQGFILPDQYQEPYTNGVTFVKFTASCGLGRLKGKYLPKDFYRDEKSLIDIFCKILSLTSVDIDLSFNPAIENSIQKDWKEIFIDTENFVERNKKKDAYSILEILLEDTLCVCYQANNCWQIEGINKRHVRSFEAKKYNVKTSQFIGVVSGQKLLKKVTSFVRPDVTIIPPYNMVSVSHERKPQGLPETISKEKNEGWAVVSGVIGEVYATDWNANNNFYCKAIEPDYYNSVMKAYTIPATGGIPVVEPFDETKFINLKNKLFLYKNQKVKINASFKIIKWSKVLSGVTPDAFNNPMLYQILLDGVVVFTNRMVNVSEKESLIFDESGGSAKLEFDWIAPNEGLLDIKIWRPSGSIYTTNIIGFEITQFEISPVNFEENIEYVDIINEEFTIDKPIKLQYADDDTGFSKAFRLGKLKEATEVYNVVEIPVLYRFTQNGNYYSVVNLDGANLIKDNINTVYHEGEILSNLEVIYNYIGGEQMVVKTDFVTTSSFSVNIYKTDDFLGSRKSWLQWTDSVYKIETSRYGQVVVNVIRRMFTEASEKIDHEVNNAVKFNDLILFNYVFEKQFVVTNCSWNLDENRTTLTIARSIYKDSGDPGSNPDNIPPIVNAGTDIELLNGQSTASLLATAYDVDGYITSQVWTKLEGGFGDIINNPFSLQTELQNLTEDFYKYEIKVTDNDGATAVDTINIIRRKDYTAILDLISLESGIIARYKFGIDPEIPLNSNLLLKGRAYMFAYNNGNTRFRIIKNGINIYEHYGSYASYDDLPFSISYISTDEIIFEIFQSGNFPDINIGSSWIDLNSVDFVSGAGNVLGVPHRYQPIRFEI